MVATIKVYSTTSTLFTPASYPAGIITDYFDASFNLDAMGGCAGGSFTVPRTVQQDFDIPNGKYIKVYDDDGTLFYTGIVKQRRKPIENKNHAYEINGLSSLIERITINSYVEFGSESNQPALNTVEEIVNYLFNNYIVPNVTGIVNNDININSLVTVEHFAINEGDDLKSRLEDLCYIARSGGDMVCWGIDHERYFYFEAISDDEYDQIATVTVGSLTVPALSGEEVAEPYTPRNAIKVIGRKGKNTGYKHNKVYEGTSVATLGRGKQLILKVPSLHRSADMDKLASGWFNTYENTGVSVTGLNSIILSGNIPKPWKGQVEYTDSVRGAIKTDYAANVTVHLGNCITYDIGLSMDPQDGKYNSDRLAPSNLDNPEDDPQGNDAQDDYELYPVDDLTALPVDIPHEWTQTQIENIPGFGGGEPGTGITIPAGGVVELQFNDTALWSEGTSEGIQVYASISNGGNAEAFTTGNPIYFYFKTINEGNGEVGISSVSGELVSTAGDVETWKTQNVFTPTVTGKVYVAVRIETAPSTFTWYPVDVSGSDWAKASHCRVFDISSYATTYIFNVINTPVVTGG